LEVLKGWANKVEPIWGIRLKGRALSELFVGAILCTHIACPEVAGVAS